MQYNFLQSGYFFLLEKNVWTKVKLNLYAHIDTCAQTHVGSKKKKKRLYVFGAKTVKSPIDNIFVEKVSEIRDERKRGIQKGGEVI